MIQPTSKTFFGASHEANLQAGQSKKQESDKILKVAGTKSFLLRSYGDEETAFERIVRLNDRDSTTKSAILILPGVEGVSNSAYKTLANELNAPTYVLQTLDLGTLSNIDDIVKEVLPDINEIFKNHEYFYLIGHSFGALLGLEIARKLEDEGKIGHLLLIDGAPKFLKKMVVDSIPSRQTTEDVQSAVIRLAVVTLFPEDHPRKIQPLLKIASWNQKVNKLAEIARPYHNYTDTYYKKIINVMVYRSLIALRNDVTVIKAIKSGITLVRPTEQISVAGMEHDYGLGVYTKGKFNVELLKGTHSTVIDNPKLSVVINENDPSSA